MKSFIFTRNESFDMAAIEPRIDEIRNAFDRYLDSYAVKTSRSKHGLMGPVGKIFQEVKGGKWDAVSLTGYALNIHLSNPKAKGISDSARAALDQGVTKLIDLLKSSPVAAHDRILDRIDYGLYYMRRKKGFAWLESVKNDWVDFLRTRYKDGESLAAAWGEKIDRIGNDFERVPYPGKQIFNIAKGEKRNDMVEFAQHAQLKGYSIEEEDDE